MSSPTVLLSSEHRNVAHRDVGVGAVHSIKKPTPNIARAQQALFQKQLDACGEKRWEPLPAPAPPTEGLAGGVGDRHLSERNPKRALPGLQVLEEYLQPCRQKSSGRIDGMHEDFRR
jgi:hypothetical protein